MDTSHSSRQYSQEQVNAILRRALERQGKAGMLTHDELLETARELGIDASQVEAAAAEQDAVGEFEAAKEEWLLRRRKKFFDHLRAYIIVNGFLILMGVFASGDDAVWVLWPIFGWGIGLAFDASDTFWPKEEKVERGARRMVEQRRRRARHRSGNRKGVMIDSKSGKIIIEKGDKYIQIG